MMTNLFAYETSTNLPFSPFVTSDALDFVFVIVVYKINSLSQAIIFNNFTTNDSHPGFRTTIWVFLRFHHFNFP